MKSMFMPIDMAETPKKKPEGEYRAEALWPAVT